jgi:hypothetical protein
MILDNEQQRKFLLELFAQVNFPGAAIDIAYALKRAIQMAGVAAESSETDGPPPIPTLGRP